MNTKRVGSRSSYPANQSALSQSVRALLLLGVRGPENLSWCGQLVQDVAEGLRAASKIGEDAGAISVLVVGGAGVCIFHSMPHHVVEQDGDLARGRSHRFGLADACGEPSIEGAESRLCATDGYCGGPAAEQRPCCRIAAFVSKALCP